MARALQLAAPIVCLLLAACSPGPSAPCEVVRAAIADISTWPDGQPPEAGVGALPEVQDANWTPVQSECGDTTVNSSSGRTRITRVAMLHGDLAGLTISAAEPTPPEIMNTPDGYTSARTWDCSYRRSGGHWRRGACSASIVF